MIFLDTGYFRGLMDKKDQYRKNSKKIKKYLDKTIKLPRLVEAVDL